jgi:hypothetical protein
MEHGTIRDRRRDGPLFGWRSCLVGSAVDVQCGKPSGGAAHLERATCGLLQHNQRFFEMTAQLIEALWVERGHPALQMVNHVECLVEAETLPWPLELDQYNRLSQRHGLTDLE